MATQSTTIFIGHTYMYQSPLSTIVSAGITAHAVIAQKEL